MEGITGDLDALEVKDLRTKVNFFFRFVIKLARRPPGSSCISFNNTVGRLYSNNAPELEPACATFGIVQETSRCSPKHLHDRAY